MPRTTDQPLILPFGEWLPDQPDLNNPGATRAQGVIPVTAQSYGPFPAPVQYATRPSTTGDAQGAYSFKDPAGNIFVFYGDASKLYLLQAGSTAFADVSKTAGGPYAVPAKPQGFWSMTSFGSRVIATDLVDPVQGFLVGTDTKFSDLAGSPPKAKYCAAIKDFLMLGNLADGSGAQPYRLQWSAIGNETNWPTPGTLAAAAVQSDNQDLVQTDLGAITGLQGGYLQTCDGIALAEKGLWRITYTGSPNIFDFSVIQGAAGTRAPLSVTPGLMMTGFGVRGVTYYLGSDGFYACDGTISVPIGNQKVDKFFFADADPAQLRYVQGTTDPTQRLIYFAYAPNGSAGAFTKVLIYNWALQRWSMLAWVSTEGFPNAAVEFMLKTTSIGYTLDQLDQFGNLDQLQFSLDSPAWTGGNSLLGAFAKSTPAGTPYLYYFTGNPVNAYIDTAERQPFPGRRARILSARPLLDFAGLSGNGTTISIIHRDSLINATTAEAATFVNSLGECPQHVEAGYVRAELAIAGNTGNWKNAQGIQLTARPAGRYIK